MPTRQQLEDALIKAHNNGDTDAAELFAGMIKGNEYEDAVSDDTSFLGSVGEFFKGIPGGFLETQLTGLEGSAEIADALTNTIGADDLIDSGEENALVDFARSGQDKIQEFYDPAYADQWIPKAGRALGSLAGFLVPGMGWSKVLTGAGKAVKAAPMLGFSGSVGAGEAAQRIQMAREQGIDVSEGTEDAAIGLGTVVGFSELLPVQRIMKGLDKDVLTKPVWDTLAPRLINAAKSAAFEGGQEVFAGLSQDLIERGLYNENLPIGQSAWDEMTLGGFAGFTADLLLNAVAGRRMRGMHEQGQKEFEQKLRKTEKDYFEEQSRTLPPEERQQMALQLGYDSFEDADPDRYVQAAREIENELGTDFPIERQFMPVQVAGQKWAVQDDGGNQYGEPLDTLEQASQMSGALNERALDRMVDQEVELAIGQSGVEYTPAQRVWMKIAGRRLMHPQVQFFTPDQVNYAGQTTLESGYRQETASAKDLLEAGVKPADMTVAQRINVKRLKKGLPETGSFTVQEAKRELGDSFGNLVDFQYNQFGENETFKAGKKNGKPIIISSLGQEITTRKESPTSDTFVPFKSMKEAGQLADQLNKTGNKQLAKAELFGPESIGVKDIQNVLKQRNITSEVNSPEVRAIAKMAVGANKKVTDMNDGELRMMHKAVRSLPKMQTPMRLPTFGTRPYTTRQYAVAKEAAIKNARDTKLELGEAPVIKREELEQRAGPIAETAFNRLLKDVSADRTIRETVERERMDARQRELADRANAKRLTRQQERAATERRTVQEAMANAFKGFGLDRVKTAVTDVMRDAAFDENGRVIYGEARDSEGRSPAAFRASMNTVFGYTEALKQDKRYQEVAEKPDDVRLDTLAKIAVDSMNHEVLHVLRQMDIFTQQEWDKLKNISMRQRRKDQDGGDTYMNWAKKAYKDKTPLIIQEEAIAEMIRDGINGDLKIGGQPKSFMQRVLEFFKGILRIKNTTGYESFDDIVAAIKSGEIAQRPTVDEQGDPVVRTLRVTEELGQFGRANLEQALPAETAATEGPEEQAGEAAPPAQRDEGQRQSDWMERRRYQSGDKAGQYVAGPPGIDSPQKLAGLVRSMTERAKKGAIGKDWYERSSDAILQFVGGNVNEAEKIVQAIAVTSPTTPVGANLEYALQAYAQWKAGKPIFTGKYPVKMSQTLEDIFNGKQWEGRKTNNFYNNLMSEIDPSRVQGTTVDIWMMRAFGYWQAAPSDAQYTFVENEVEKIADKLGWKPHQVQAAIWVEMKARMQNSKVKRLTDKLSERNGWIEWVERVDGEGNVKMVRKIINEQKHFDNWLKHAIRHRPTRADYNKAKFDYKDAMDATLAQVSWESIPGRTSGHMPEARTAPKEVLLEYHRRIAQAFLDPNGRDMLADHFGLPSPGDFEAPGFYEGNVSPGTQTEVSAPRQFKAKAGAAQVQEESVELIEAYASARGILMRQDSVGWHRPFFVGPKADRNGMELSISKTGRAITEEEMSRLAEAVARETGNPDYVPVASPSGVRFIRWTEGWEGGTDNFVDPANPTKEEKARVRAANKKFVADVKRAIESVQMDGNDGVSVEYFATDSGYLSNDWSENPNGENYRTRTDGRPHSPDLQRRIQSIVRQVQPRIQAVDADFAERYGWTPTDDFRFQRTSRPAESAGGPGAGVQEGSQRSGIPAQSGQRRAKPLNLSGGSPRLGTVVIDGVHFGKQPVDILRGDMYGTGIKGAERVRLENADPRIKRRVYFYIEEDMSTAHPYMQKVNAETRARSPRRKEMGVGANVHYQRFNNVLDPTTPEGKAFSDQYETDNEFELALVENGYDGFVSPTQGMMVILNKDVPVYALGHDQDLQEAGVTNIRDDLEGGIRDIIKIGPTEIQQALEKTQQESRNLRGTGVPKFNENADGTALALARNLSDMSEKELTALVDKSKKFSDYKFMRKPDMNPQDQAFIDSIGVGTPQGRSPMDPWVNASQAGMAITPENNLKRWFTKMRQQFVNQYDQIEKYNWMLPELRENLADSGSIQAILMKDRAKGMIASAIKYGIPVYQDGAFFVYNQKIADELGINVPGVDAAGVKSLIEVMAPLYSEQYGDLSQLAQTYAIAQRSAAIQQRNLSNALTPQGPIRTPVSPQAKARVEQLIQPYVDENGNNIIKQWFRDYQQYNEAVINMMQKSGILTEETADLWRNEASYYPFYRTLEDGGDLFQQSQRVPGGLTKAAQLKRMRGSKDTVNMDLVEAIAMNMGAAVEMSMKNVAQQRVIRDMKQFGLAREVLGAAPAEAHVVEFYVNGKKRRFEVLDPLVYESLKPLDNTDAVSMVRNTFGKPATWLRELVTRDPGFMLINMFRDSLSATVTSGSRMKPLASMIKGWAEGIQTLEQLGVVGGYDYANDPDNIGRFFGKELKRAGIDTENAPGLFMRAWDAFGRGTSRSDSAVRNEIFKDVYSRTNNLAEAQFQSMEVMNFGRRGRNTIFRMLTATVPFLNARIQGMDVFWRSAMGRYTTDKEMNRRQITQSMLMRGGLLSGLTYLYWLLASDTDQYKEAPDFVRENNWLIPTEWGVPVTLPIPFEVGLLFKTIPEAFYNKLAGKTDSRETYETLKRGITSTMELNPLQIQFIGPLAESWINWDSFKGQNVVPFYLAQTVEPGEQSRDYTNQIAKMIGQKLNISPMKIDHTMKGYVGTIGGYVLSLIDLGLRQPVFYEDRRAMLPANNWYDYPVVRRAFGRANDRGLVEDAYDMYNHVKLVNGTMNKLKKEGRFDELQAYVKDRQHILGMKGTVNNIKKQLDYFSNAKAMIRRADMSPEEKKQRTDELDRVLNEMLIELIPHLKKIMPRQVYEPLYPE